MLVRVRSTLLPFMAIGATKGPFFLIVLPFASTHSRFRFAAKCKWAEVLATRLGQVGGYTGTHNKLW